MNQLVLHIIFEEKAYLIKHLELISELLYYDYESGTLEKAVTEVMLLELQKWIHR